MSINSLKILYVEENDEIRDTMKELLEYQVSEFYSAQNGIEALSIYKNKKPNLIITNANLPKVNGIDLIKEIREKDHATKIIVLTPNSDVNTLIEASELQLTKYLLLPTKGNDLYQALEKVVKELESFSVVEHDFLSLKEGYRWSFEEKVLQKNLQEIHLTPKEKKVLDYFFSNPNITITYDMLLYEVWDESATFSMDVVKTLIKTLRKKLPKNTIKNIYGIGFKFEP